MIDISPKALRFARLAAEQQATFSASPLISAIKSEEAAFAQKVDERRIRRHVEVSDAMAAFCLKAVTSLLEQQDKFEGSDWDGNDFVFMQSIARDLSRQLAATSAQAL